VIAPSLSFLNDPRCPLGVPSGTVRATIRFASTQSGNDTGELPLPCQNWDDTGSGYRYRDPELDDGPCRDVSISTGRRIKATCLGKGATTDLPYDLTPGTDEDAVHAVLTLGGVRYCTTFEDFNGKDGSDGKRFLGKNAPPPAACARCWRRRPRLRQRHPPLSEDQHLRRFLAWPPQAPSALDRSFRRSGPYLGSLTSAILPGLTVRVLCEFDGAPASATVHSSRRRSSFSRTFAPRRARPHPLPLAWHSRGREFDSPRLHLPFAYLALAQLSHVRRNRVYSARSLRFLGLARVRTSAVLPA
jgi:hypothetical protein